MTRHWSVPIDLSRFPDAVPVGSTARWVIERRHSSSGPWEVVSRPLTHGLAWEMIAYIRRTGIAPHRVSPVEDNKGESE